jgi:hypothetical protein
VVAVTDTEREFGMKKRLMEVQIPTRLLFNQKSLSKAIQDGVTSTAEAVRVDFVATTNTWKHKPKFVKKSNGFASTTISTDDQIWNMLEVGTRPHIIKPKPTNKSGMLRFRWNGPGSYGAKTRPGWLSSKGAKYPTTPVRRRMVKHPGTKARKWTIAARDKYAKLMPRIMQRAIDSVVTRG